MITAAAKEPPKEFIVAPIWTEGKANNLTALLALDDAGFDLGDLLSPLFADGGVFVAVPFTGAGLLFKGVALFGLTGSAGLAFAAA